MEPGNITNQERWHVLQKVKTEFYRTKSGDPVEYRVYLNVIVGGGPTAENEIKTLKKLEELGIIKILNAKGNSENAEEIFEIEIIQPVFDDSYNQYEEAFTSAKLDPRDKLLIKLRSLQGEIDEIDKGGRSKGKEMTALFSKVLPLIERIDIRLHEQFVWELDRFEKLYGVNMYNGGNTFVPHLETCISLVDRAIKKLETEKEFPEQQKTSHMKEEKVKTQEKVPAVQINNPQMHFGQGDNTGRDKTEPLLKDAKGWKWNEDPFRIVFLMVIGGVIIGLVLYYGFGIGRSGTNPSLKSNSENEQSIIVQISESDLKQSPVIIDSPNTQVDASIIVNKTLPEIKIGTITDAKIEGTSPYKYSFIMYRYSTIMDIPASYEVEYIDLELYEVEIAGEDGKDKDRDVFLDSYRLEESFTSWGMERVKGPVSVSYENDRRIKNIKVRLIMGVEGGLVKEDSRNMWGFGGE